MRKSYSAACSDPQNELIHLYEIRDAAATRFGGGKQAQSQLGITDWDEFHKVCNDCGLVQDRHRGSSYSALRSATEEELALARKVASDIIERYVAYLENLPGENMPVADGG